MGHFTTCSVRLDFHCYLSLGFSAVSLFCFYIDDHLFSWEYFIAKWLCILPPLFLIQRVEKCRIFIFVVSRVYIFTLLLTSPKQLRHSHMWKGLGWNLSLILRSSNSVIKSVSQVRTVNSSLCWYGQQFVRFVIEWCCCISVFWANFVDLWILVVRLTDVLGEQCFLDKSWCLWDLCPWPILSENRNVHRIRKFWARGSPYFMQMP